jgi:hypothetical protein
MMQSVGRLFIRITFVSLLVLAHGFSADAVTCDYYASPSGGGNGLSSTRPFKIANFWAVAGPGKTLCLLDGIYTDSSSMIRPPENLNGTAAQKITIRSLNDGGARINGGRTQVPVKLRNNDHFILEGFDAHNGPVGQGYSAVVLLETGADNNVVRRVVAWDASPSENTQVIASNRNTGNLFEDVAGFGTGRKIFTAYSSTDITFRRMWGRFEQTLTTMPATVASIGYRSTNIICENCIGTWNHITAPSTGERSVFTTGSQSRDGICVNIKFLGSIAYLRTGDNVVNGLPGFKEVADSSCLTFKDNVIYVGPGISAKPLLITSSEEEARLTGLVLTNTTEIGGQPSNLTGPWNVVNRVTMNTVSAAPSIWNGAGGARVCKRYLNGTLTSTPLWPWPMNQRIIDAMRVAGKTPVDVTKTMEEIFGPIPSECRASSVASAAPAPAPTASVPSSPASLTAR